jgi:lipoate-protein ligase B
MGRRTLSAHLRSGEATLRATGAAIEPSNRGGSITFHGPGQLVGYPILNLSHFASGPKEYVWLLEETLRSTLVYWGIESHRVDKTPGLFVGPSQEKAKIASIGIRVDRGITLHGFALNIDLDLTPFSYIIPCGLEAYRTTSIAALRQSSVPVRLIARQVAEQFGRLFNVTWEDVFLDLSGNAPTGAYTARLARKNS